MPGVYITPPSNIHPKKSLFYSNYLIELILSVDEHYSTRFIFSPFLFGLKILQQSSFFSGNLDHHLKKNDLVISNRRLR
ncbi:hypothetical protein DERP_009248 [Dermatophagoides pteronyssinus]|uniref:Uncharacterized protein n=1 Tax=Dermatophagoides pteronyssinus TaxID=6956 RepID=A0ABQ8JQZ3_DERPT|nr:hypothetical protein DERP_009248 [Dermatophagoides pteronyssinus]